MLSLTPNQIKKEADLRIATTPGNHKKLIAIYSAVALGAGFLCQIIDFITNLMMENTGGLSGLGARAILGTVNSLFPLAVNLLLPLWMLGLMSAALRLCRQERVDANHLKSGFSRWGVLLRLSLLEGLLLFGVAYLTMQVSTILFSVTNLSYSAMEFLSPYAADLTLLETAMEDPAFVADLFKTMAPMLILWAVLLLAVMIPLLYSLRLSYYRIVDIERPGALRAMGESRKMMKGNKWQLFKLDLSFWWYYLLQVLLALLLEVPVFLANSLVSFDAAMLIAAALQALGSFYLQYRFLLKMEVSYALFYDTLYEAHKAPPVQPNYWQQ